MEPYAEPMRSHAVLLDKMNPNVTRPRSAAEPRRIPFPAMHGGSGRESGFLGGWDETRSGLSEVR